MIFQTTKLKGVYVVEWEPKGDERGFFGRNFAKEEFAAQGIEYNIVHINRSFNRDKGTTRGFHIQLPPKAEDKLMQCIRGRIYDVVLDLRKNSPTYGEWVSVELTEDNRKMILVPKGCANGIQTMEDNSALQYFVTEVYSAEHERGVRFNDPAFKVKWPSATPSVISEKDANWPLVSEGNKIEVEL